jgi:hypothetical protein
VVETIFVFRNLPSTTMDSIREVRESILALKSSGDQHNNHPTIGS